MIYDCYLDDSKDARQEYVYTCGGFIAPQFVWKSFPLEWNKVLALEGLKYWKTSEAKGLSGQFSKYRGLERSLIDEKLISIKNRLMQVALKHSRMRGIALSIPVSVYAEVMAHPSAPLVYRDKDLYDRAFEGVLIKAAQYAQSGYVGFVHDDGQDFDHLRSVYNTHTKVIPTNAKRMAGFIPLDDKSHPPLQLADMFANSVMGRHRDLLNGIPVDRAEVDFIEESDVYTWTREFGMATLRVELTEKNLPVPDDLIESTQYLWDGD